MNIAEKIEEIRRKPENEKIRYVWGMVFLSMFFIVFIWIFSVKDMLRGGNRTNSSSNIIEDLDQSSVVEDGANNNVESDSTK